MQLNGHKHPDAIERERPIAQEIARREGCGPAYFVDDYKGGYWQAAHPETGPYTFRVVDLTSTL